MIGLWGKNIVNMKLVINLMSKTSWKWQLILVILFYLIPSYLSCNLVFLIHKIKKQNLKLWDEFIHCLKCDKYKPQWLISCNWSMIFESINYSNRKVNIVGKE
jgi:hypothetical protein